MKRLVVFSSGSGNNLKAILEACADGRIPAEVAALVSDKKCGAIHVAEDNRIPIIFHPWGKYKKVNKHRSTYDRDLALKVWMYQPDLIVLADWQRLLTEGFLERYGGRVINHHPALPGQFSGKGTIERIYNAYQRGEMTETGVNTHVLTGNAEEKTMLIQSASVPIFQEDDLKKLQERVHAADLANLVESISKILQK